MHGKIKSGHIDIQPGNSRENIIELGGVGLHWGQQMLSNYHLKTHNWVS